MSLGHITLPSAHCHISFCKHGQIDKLRVSAVSRSSQHMQAENSRPKPDRQSKLAATPLAYKVSYSPSGSRLRFLNSDQQFLTFLQRKGGTKTKRMNGCSDGWRSWKARVKGRALEALEQKSRLCQFALFRKEQVNVVAHVSSQLDNEAVTRPPCSTTMPARTVVREMRYKNTSFTSTPATDENDVEQLVSSSRRSTDQLKEAPASAESFKSKKQSSSS